MELANPARPLTCKRFELAGSTRDDAMTDVANAIAAISRTTCAASGCSTTAEPRARQLAAIIRPSTTTTVMTVTAMRTAGTNPRSTVVARGSRGMGEHYARRAKVLRALSWALGPLARKSRSPGRRRLSNPYCYYLRQTLTEFDMTEPDKSVALAILLDEIGACARGELPLPDRGQLAEWLVLLNRLGGSDRAND